MAVARNRCT